MSAFREKEKIRKRLLALRRGMRQEEIIAGSKRASVRLLATPEFTSSRAVLFYAALPEEMQTRESVEKALIMGKKIFLPRTEKNKLRIFEIKSYERNTKEGAFHILEPVAVDASEVSPEALDLIVVPGVAFDARGRRIGFGKGYYDRFLKNVDPNAPIVGLAFESQLVPVLPRTLNDRAVDMIVTDKRIIRCREIQS